MSFFSNDEKVIPFAEMTKADFRELASKFADDAGDMCIDEGHMEEESDDGHTLIALIRGLADHFDELAND